MAFSLNYFSITCPFAVDVHQDVKIDVFFLMLCQV